MNSRIDLLALGHDLMQQDNQNIYRHEIAIVIPVINQAEKLSQAIDILIDNNLYIGSLSLLRSLIEATAVLVYDCTIEKDEEYYAQFLQNGRLMMRDSKKKRWVRLPLENLISNLEEVTKLKIKETYDNCCNALHFSTRHMQLLATGTNEDDNTVYFSIRGDDSELPPEKFQEIRDCMHVCRVIIAKYVLALIEQKKLKSHT